MTIRMVSKMKVALWILGGGAMLDNGGCLPDNFFVDLANVAASTAVSEFVAAIVGLFVLA